MSDHSATVETHNDQGAITALVMVDYFEDGSSDTEVYLEVADYTTRTGKPLHAVAIMTAAEARQTAADLVAAAEQAEA